MPPPLNAIDPRLRTLYLRTALFSIMVAVRIRVRRRC
jgi:hypothetical protein